MRKKNLLYLSFLFLASCHFFYRPEPYPFSFPPEAKDEEILQKIPEVMIQLYEKEDLKNYLKLFTPLSPHYKKLKKLAEEDFQEYEKIRIKKGKTRFRKLEPAEATLTFSIEFKGRGRLKQTRKVPMKSSLRFVKEKGHFKLYALETEPIPKIPRSLSPLPRPRTSLEKQLWKDTRKIQDILTHKNLEKLKPYLHSESNLYETWQERLQREKKEGKEEKISIAIAGGKVYLHPQEANVHIYFQATIEESFPYVNTFLSQATLECVKEKEIWKIYNLSFQRKK